VTEILRCDKCGATNDSRTGQWMKMWRSDSREYLHFCEPCTDRFRKWLFKKEDVG
jgi:hypothetical protein